MLQAHAKPVLAAWRSDPVRAHIHFTFGLQKQEQHRVEAELDEHLKALNSEQRRRAELQTKLQTGAVSPCHGLCCTAAEDSELLLGAQRLRATSTTCQQDVNCRPLRLDATWAACQQDAESCCIPCSAEAE